MSHFYEQLMFVMNDSNKVSSYFGEGHVFCKSIQIFPLRWQEI